MNILSVLVTYVMWVIFLTTYANTTDEIPNINFPTLDTPDIDFIDVSAGCGGFTDCIEYIGAILYNFVAGVIFLILFIINLLIYIFALLAILISVSFTGIDGAPWQFNTFIITVNAAVIALIIFFLIRSGKSDATD